MTKLKTIWHIVGKYKYWATLGAFILIIGVLDELTFHYLCST